MPAPGLLKKIDLNITNQCNLRCTHCCFSSGEGDLGHLPAELLLRFLSEAWDLGARRVDITGGEALTRPDIFDIIQGAKAIGYRIELLSNGIALQAGVVKRLKGLGLDAVGVSLESIHAEEHAAIRGTQPGQFRTILEAVDLCVAEGFYTKVNSVVFRSNYRSLHHLARWCQDHGVREHGIYYLTPIGRGAELATQVLAPREWLDYVGRELKPLQGSLELSIEVAYLDEGIAAPLETRCFIRRPHHLQILPSGDIFPCAIMSVWKKPLGNIRHESIRQIWTDEARWSAYNGLMDELFATHGGCVDYAACGHDTAGMAFVCPVSKHSPAELCPATARP